MARKIIPSAPLSDIRDNNNYTRGVCRAEALTVDLAPTVEGWNQRLDGLEAEEKGIAEAQSDVDARGYIANWRLDQATMRLGREVLVAVDGDRSAARMKQFFGERSPSDFCALPRTDQARAIRAWRAEIQDPLLDKWWPELEQHTKALECALTDADALSARRARFRLAREEHATWLTSQRDALERQIAERGEAAGEDREWPSTFFRRGG